jgi:hypothetical protein
MRKLVKELNGPVGRKMSTLLAGGQIEEEIAKAFQTRWFEPWRAAARQFLKRGVERGEVRKEVDMEVVLDALYGPIYFRLLGGHAPLTTGFADELAEMVMRGLEQAGRVRAKAKL